MDNWTSVAPLDELPEDDVVELPVNGQLVALYRIGEEVFATAPMCPHGNARLCDGFLEGFEIECPLHQGRLDVRTGQHLCEPLTGPVRTHPVEVEGGAVFLKLE